MIIIFAAAFFLVSVALLFPSYISLSLEKRSLVSENSVLEKEIRAKEKKGVFETLSLIKSDLTLSNPSDTLIYESISTILQAKPSKVTIKSIKYTHGENAKSSITIQGNAGDRFSLIGFSNNLKKELMFTTVDLPISNLAKQTDVDFNLTLIGDF